MPKKKSSKTEKVNKKKAIVKRPMKISSNWVHRDNFGIPPMGQTYIH
jgi:hypothetical protein